ncbi:hypothetical protein Tco_0695373 [Tanacetum coccineum]
MNDPICVKKKVKIAPHDYSKENYLATFTPQKQLTPEQIFWSDDLLKKKAKALKEKAKSAKLITVVTVYPLNTPAKLVPNVLPIKSQVQVNIYSLVQLFLEFDKTCKKRITPTGLTEEERGFEQTKTCYLTEEMKEVFDQIEAEVDQNAVEKKCDEIERKNILIENENLIAECLSKDVFYTATDFVLTNKDLTIKVNALQDLNECFRAENEKVKQHYKELYDSIKLTRAKTFEKTNSLLAEIENLKAQIKGKMTCVTMPAEKLKALAPGVKGATAASGSKPRRNTKNDRTLPAKSDKQKVEDHPRINKSSVIRKNHVDYSISYKR